MRWIPLPAGVAQVAKRFREDAAQEFAVLLDLTTRLPSFARQPVTMGVELDIDSTRLRAL